MDKIQLPKEVDKFVKDKLKKRKKKFIPCMSLIFPECAVPGGSHNSGT